MVVPEAPGMRVSGNTLENHFGHAQRQRSVGDVGVAGDPADIGSAPVDIAVRLGIEHPLHGEDGPQQIAAGGMLHAFGLAGGARGIEDEQWMLGGNPHRLAALGLSLGKLMPPQVARAPVHRPAGTAIHHHALDAGGIAHRQRLVDRALQRHRFAAAHRFVRGDDQLGLGILDAFEQTLRRKAAEHHRMDGADTGARLHRHHRLDAHRHVDDDAVALLDAERFQAIGKLAHPRMKLLVGDLGHRTVVGLENQRGLVAPGGQMTIQAVVRHIELAVVEPLVERRGRFVEGTGERRFPVDGLAREIRPEPLIISFGLSAQGLIPRHARDIRLFDERVRRRKYTSFGQNRLDGCHTVSPLIECLITSNSNPSHAHS